MPRLTLFALISLALLAAIGFVSPIQLPVVLYKCGLVTLGAVLGYWLDRALFPYARPHQFFGRSNAAITQQLVEEGLAIRREASIATIRRALIVVASVLGMTMGL